MITVGGREILISCTALIPQDEELRIDYDITHTDHLACVFRFHPENKQADGKPLIKFDYIDNVFVFDFVGFNDPGGHSLGVPHEFGRTDNKEPLTFVCSIQKLPKLTRIDFQIMKGVAE